MTKKPRAAESGNVIFFILLAIALIGLVTAAIRSGNDGMADVDRESVTLDATKIKQYAGELERGIAFIMNNSASEVDIRFAYAGASSDYGDIATTPKYQLFSPQGGGAEYRLPPPGANDGSRWEFYGTTAMPHAGSAKADLIAVLPKMAPSLCAKLNDMDGFPPATPPADSGTCFAAPATPRFGPSTQYNDSSPHTLNAASFPAGKVILDACVTCQDGTLNYVHVLHVR